MGVSWTKEQQQVISLRNRNILVSAAAGSGKTAVLVERIITRLTDEKSPLDVDRLLVVTFTEAAAAEMKERIRGAIEKKLEEDPENVHLQRQATMIHHAQITTIHSFCLSVIKDYFHTIDLEPGFRTAEEGERKLLMQEVMEELLEKAYEEDSEPFLFFAEAMAPGRDDKKLEELIFELYEFSRSNPKPEEWLEQCVVSYEKAGTCKWDELSFVQCAAKNTCKYLEDMEESLLFAKSVCQEADGPAVYEKVIDSDIGKIRDFSSADGFTELQKKMAGLKFDRLPSNRDPSVSEEKAELVKKLRDQVKKEISSLKEQYFQEPAMELQKDMEMAAPVARELVRLTILFARAFEEKKQERNMIDFSDMEQYALRILEHEEVADEFRDRFEEVMIDEYQDSNLIQETLLMQISRMKRGQYNVFMVGDVKQSIYSFRLSRPELFMEKYESYSMEDGKEQRIDLHKNFRSRREVLDAVNFLFYQIMTKELGKIQYDENAALYVGATFEETKDCETELLLIEEGEELPARELEARAVAAKIKDIVKHGQVKDKETGRYRNASYKDIVILLRSLQGWSDVFAKVLSEQGIPTYSGTKEGYFKTREIGLLLDYLRVLDNEKQDLPLTAVLTSVFGKMTDEELAQIRLTYPNLPYHEAVSRYRQEHENKKLQEFYDMLRRFREKVPYTAMHELLEEIVTETGYRDHILAMPGGIQRSANLDMLIEKAKAFESSSYKGLFHFIRYIEQLKKYDIDYGEAITMDENADTVRIMSIHKSKGLEFPVVIAAGMGKRFNLQDITRKVVIHQDFGIGLDAVYLKERMQTASFLKKVIQKEIRLENLGEELRVLYVALTRAKEKLIMTGVVGDAAESLQKYERIRRREVLPLSFGTLASAGTYLDFLLPAMVRLEDRKRNGEEIPLRMDVISEKEILLETSLEEVQKQITREDIRAMDIHTVYDSQMKEKLSESFSFCYPYLEESGWSRKFTVSELKRRAYEPETAKEETDGEQLYKEDPEDIIPAFMKEEVAVEGASRGTAYHRILELLDFTATYTEKELNTAIASFVKENKITDEAAKAVGRKGILTFLGSECAGRIRKAALEGKLKKEQPFVFGIPASRIYDVSEGNEETILIQGIIDLYFEEDGEIVLLDYKTDWVKKEEELREKYRIQLDYYAEALEKSLGKKVKEKIIYSFALRKEIRV